MISKSELDAVRQAADIVQVVGSYGHDLRRSGKSFKCCCPFHEERTPSFDVDPEKRTFKCFGCEAQGDVFKFVMMSEALNFAAAVQKVAVTFGVQLRGGTDHEEDKAERVFKRFSEPRSLTLDQWRGYAQRFRESSRAQEEIKVRGLSREVCEAAQLGWADDGRQFCKPDHPLVDKPWIGFPYVYGDRVRLAKWRVAFSCGKEFQRVPGMADCLFVDGPPDPLEGLYLTEGEVDALTLRMIGVRAASIPSGFQSKIDKPTREYLLAFRKLYACLDNDEDGRLLLRRLLIDLPADKVDVVTIPEEFKDANGLLVKGCDRDLAEFGRRFGELVAGCGKPSTIAFSDLDKSFELYLQRLREKRPAKFWEWPWVCVDRMAVVAPGQVVTITCGRSGQGQTSFTVEACLHNALKLGRRIAYYTAEVDPVDEMVPIVTAQLTDTDRDELQAEDVQRARTLCRDADFYLGYDPEAKNWDDVAALLDMAVRRIGVDVAVVDHLDFVIRDPDWSRENAQKSLATRWLKTKLARRYGVLVIVLKKAVKPKPGKQRQRGDEEADVYDQSGPASQISDADHAFILHRAKRSRLSEADGEDIFEDETKVILGKTRRKGKGSAMATLVFRGKYAKFEAMGDDRRREPAAHEPSLPYKDE